MSMFIALIGEAFEEAKDQQVSLQWKNTGLLFKIPDFLLRNVDLIVKTRAR